MIFKLVFYSIREYQDVRHGARSIPRDFYHLRLIFNVAARSRIAQISIDSIRQGWLFSKLEQKFPNSDSVLLTEDDTRQLLHESMAEVMVENFDDTEVPKPSSGARIYDMLEEMLTAK